MKTSLNKCRDCGNYTLKTTCATCGKRTYPSIPPRYSPEDRWGKYRRLLVKNTRENENG